MIKNYSIFVLALFISGGLVFVHNVWAQTSGITATVQITVCGNNIKETGEQCDGSDLDNKSCVALGFGGGTLSCLPSCEFNTSACTTTAGGGGGGGYVPPPPETKVIFEGRAYPLSRVNVLKDGQLAIGTIAGPDAKFYASLAGLSSGNYIFAVYGEDSQGRRSALFTFSVFVTQGAATKISGIFISPTIAVDKSEVRRGDNIAIFGQTAPQTEVTIAVSSEEEFFAKTKTDNAGVYLYNFDTSPLVMGQHFTKSKSALNGEISSFSKAVSFIVGTKTVLNVKPEVLKGDLNSDGRVNLIDFSIAAYWYRRPMSAAFTQTEAERLNGDGRVDLVDFSIMAYYWTG